MRSARLLVAVALVPELRALGETPSGGLEIGAAVTLRELTRDDRVPAVLRDAVLTATNDAGLMTRPTWNVLPTLAPYAACPSAPVPVARARGPDQPLDLGRRGGAHCSLAMSRLSTLAVVRSTS